MTLSKKRKSNLCQKQGFFYLLPGPADPRGSSPACHWAATGRVDFLKKKRPKAALLAKQSIYSSLLYSTIFLYLAFALQACTGLHMQCLSFAVFINI